MELLKIKTCTYDAVKSEVKGWLKESDFIKKQFAAVWLLYGVGISAILRANFNYIDDMGRVAEGYKGWNSFSRYLSSLLSVFIHTDGYLADISPLPQLLAAAITAISGVILLYMLSEKRRFSVGGAIALVPLGLSPYFLECISYKYDSPYMALSIFGAVFPLLFYKGDQLLYAGMTVMGTLVVCMTYQAASGIFPMAVVLLCFEMWNKGENIKKIGSFLLYSIGGYGAGLLFFKIVLMRPTVDSYVSNSIPAIDQILPTVLGNFKRYYTLIQSDFKPIWLLLALLFMAAFVYVSVRDSRQKKSAAVLMAVFVLAVAALLMFGMYPLLEAPSFSPRGMYGVGAFLALIGIPIATTEKAYPAKLISLMLSWVFIVFAFVYGNALSVQSTYTDFRIGQVISDLNDIEAFAAGEPVIVQISGNIGYSPVLRGTMEHYPLLTRLVPITFRETWYWGQYGFYHYYGLKNAVWDSSINLSEYDLPVLKEHMYHTIKGTDAYVLVELK